MVWRLLDWTLCSLVAEVVEGVEGVEGFLVPLFFPRVVLVCLEKLQVAPVPSVAGLREF